jgi:hypothetical protein
MERLGTCTGVWGYLKSVPVGNGAILL